jgi:ATP-binding cassette subfamily B protein
MPDYIDFQVINIKFLIKRFFKKYLRYFIIGPLAKLFEAVLELLTPLIMASIIDNGQTLGKGYVTERAGLMVLLGVLGLASAMVCQYMGSRAGQDIGTDIRNALFEKINTFDALSMEKIGASSLITRLGSDINQVQSAAAMFIRLAVRAPFLIIGAAVMALFLDRRLSAVFIILVPLLAFALWFITKKTIPMYRAVQGKLDRLTAVFAEHISGVRVIRAFGNEQREETRFEQANALYRTSLAKTGRVSAILNPFTFALLNLSIAYIIYAGSIQITAGTLTTGKLIAFIGYLTQISLSLGVLANLIVLFTKAAVSANRITEAFNIEPQVKNTQNVTLPETPGNTMPLLAFENVSFRYENTNDNALVNVSFTVRPGETLGIIGLTGSGKSTLAGLIPRFYDVSDGAVSFCGTDIRHLDIKRLREKIRVIPQKSVLFSGTILDNLRFGHKTADAETAKAALTAACMADFDPDTPVSAGGKNFSGGQRQRLCIARAVIHSKDTIPQLIIADDSFSALDRKTEAELRGNLRAYLPDTAFIVISQRISSIQNADKILVLSDGETVGYGTHEELLESNEHYRGIYETQAE